MSSSTDRGYGSYEPPKEEKRHPLTRSDTRTLYDEATNYPDREAELVVRTLLDFGLRIGELVHMRAHWVDREFQRPVEKELWRIRVPKTEYCWGGKESNPGQGNQEGANLHETNAPCAKCNDRNWKGKVDPDSNKEGWLTWKQAEEYDYAPKSERSATKVWAWPGVEEMSETARMLKDFLKAQPHEQWPHGENAVRTRLNRVVEQADLNFPDRSKPKIVPHGLRHTYGCRLVEMGLGEGAAMKQMRHQSPDVFRWYSDVRGTRVVAALNNAVSEADSLLHD